MLLRPSPGLGGPPAPRGEDQVATVEVRLDRTTDPGGVGGNNDIGVPQDLRVPGRGPGRGEECARAKDWMS